MLCCCRGFGSSASFPCPIQPKYSSNSYSSSSSKIHTHTSSTTQQPIIVGVLMGKMKQVLAVNHTDQTMRIQASVLLGDLYQHATDAGMSVPLGLMPAWAGLTLAGVMTASAHGSGANTTSSPVSTAGDAACELPPNTQSTRKPACLTQIQMPLGWIRNQLHAGVESTV